MGKESSRRPYRINFEDMQLQSRTKHGFTEAQFIDTTTHGGFIGDPTGGGYWDQYPDQYTDTPYIDSHIDGYIDSIGGHKYYDQHYDVKHTDHHDKMWDPSESQFNDQTASGTHAESSNLPDGRTSRRKIDLAESVESMKTRLQMVEDRLNFLEGIMRGGK
jgi:hypothetical protein